MGPTKFLRGKGRCIGKNAAPCFLRVVYIAHTVVICRFLPQIWSAGSAGSPLLPEFDWHFFHKLIDWF
jgi:hypothetical protein